MSSIKTIAFSIFVTAALSEFSTTGLSDQMMPEEAQQRLEQREAERAKAATEPSGLSVAEVQALRDEIKALKIENEKLTAQIASLQPKQPVLEENPQPPEWNGKSKAQRIAELRGKVVDPEGLAEIEEGAVHKRVAIGMSHEEVEKIIDKKGTLQSQDAEGTSVYQWFIPRYIQIVDGPRAITSEGVYEFLGVFQDDKMISFSRSN